MDKTLILYSTPFCSLCEQAKSEIWPVLSFTGWQLKEVNIIDDEALLAEYQFSIPVLAIGDTNVVLNWPFAAGDIADAIDRLNG